MDTLRRISPGNPYEQRQVDRLLQKENIRRDGHLDYTCGLFDEDDCLVATGSCFGNTIRCLAVSGERQGEGLLNKVVSHLIQVQAERGHTHLFLYTKCKSARFFADLGFTEITRVDGELVFMENQRTGFSRYCTALERTRVPAQRTAGIVMNANPFTRGHRYLVEQALRDNDIVHLFVLSEEAGSIPFAVRKRLVVEGVADLPGVIVHDSGPYIISAATFPSYFLRDEDAVIRVHADLDIAVFCRIASVLGITTRYVGEEPTSRVTSLYNQVMQSRLPEKGIEVCVVPRLETGGRVISASTVRQAIHDGRLGELADMLPDSTRRFFESDEAEPVRAAIQAQENVIHY